MIKKWGHGHINNHFAHILVIVVFKTKVAIQLNDYLGESAEYSGSRDLVYYIRLKVGNEYFNSIHVAQDKIQ